MNKRNTFVFDETVVGDCCKIPLVIGVRQKSGGGNINVLRIREKALGCFIPFSMPDGSTPFRVFIFESGSKKKGHVLPQALRPIEERRLRTRPKRLFLQSEKGFLTAELFKIIMEEFIKWWKRFNPGLHCFLISDNLSIHSNDDIVRTAARHGVHMLNIMPGTSHWFQVHDQLPFANLKKKIGNKKNRYSRLFTLSRPKRIASLMGIFYKAEKKALLPHIVRKSFADVGLWPWDPEKIWKICQEHCPVDPLSQEDETVRVLANVINIHNHKQEEWLEKNLSSLEEASVTEAENYEFEIFRDEEESEDNDDEGDEHLSPSQSNTDPMPFQPPAKRPRKPSCKRKTCCIKGCEKSHIRSKKWAVCSKCNKNFCPKHAEMFRRHKC